MHDESPCACGRGLRRLKSVEGRRADTLLDREGKPIPGLGFHVFFGDARSQIVSQFQAIQKRDRSVTLRVVRGPGWSEDGFQPIARRLEAYLRGLPLQIEWVERIAPGPSGKHRTIIVES
jgi:phenylacetate-CoA ligase